MNKLVILFIFISLALLKFVQAEELPYDFSDTTVLPIKITPIDFISTKDEISDGSTIQFRVLSNVTYNNKMILEKNQIINGKLEMKVSSGMNGFPAELVIDDFNIPNVKDSQLISTYVKTGQNRCYWVFPLKWALTFLPPTGSLTNLIKGGHANLKPGRPITIYYYPNWK